MCVTSHFPQGRGGEADEMHFVVFTAEVVAPITYYLHLCHSISSRHSININIQHST